MKITLTDPSNANHKTVEMDLSGQEVMLEGVYTGVGIQTDQGLFGIAQRDTGIEVLLEGEMVFASYSDVGRLGSIHEKITTLHKLLESDGADPATLRLVGEINELVPGWVKAKSEPRPIDTDSMASEPA